jgi:MarR family transcriptional regulator for hemolysin
MPNSRDETSFDKYRAGGTTNSIRTLIKMVLVVRQFRAQLDERLRDIGQSVSRMETLSAILNMKGPKSQSDVARRLRVEGATVTRMVDILSKEELVERTPHATDRRVNLLSISAKGEAVLERIFAEYDALRHHVLDGLGAEDLEILGRLLDHMMLQLERPVEPRVRIGEPDYDRRPPAAD